MKVWRGFLLAAKGSCPGRGATEYDFVKSIVEDTKVNVDGVREVTFMGRGGVVDRKIYV